MLINKCIRVVALSSSALCCTAAGTRTLFVGNVLFVHNEAPLLHGYIWDQEKRSDNLFH